MAMVLACSMPAFAQSGSQPNILMIVVDDLNDYQEYLDDAISGLETPNMNKVARNGTVFHNAHCSAPKSCPSRTSFMSGKDPDYTGIYNNEDIQLVWRDNFRVSAKDTIVYSMAEAMKSNGYYTMGINKVYFGWKNEEYDNDYDIDNPDPCSRGLSFSKNVVITPDPSLIDYQNEGIPGFIWAPTPDSTEHLMFDVAAADTAIDFLHQYAANPSDFCNRPFMLQLGLFLPHKPLTLPEKYFPEDYIKPDEWYDEPFDPAYNEPYNAFPPNGVIMPPQPPDGFWTDFFNLGVLGQSLAKGGDNHARFEEYPNLISPKPVIDSTLSPAEVDFAIAESKRANAVAAYKAAVKFTDYHAGRVLDVLESYPGLAENTIIIFMSDHGYSLGEKTHWHKFALWDTDTRVPLVIMDPRAPAGQHVRKPVSLVDLFPTVVDYSNGTEPNFPDGSRYLDGQSLVPYVKNGNLARMRPTPTSMRKTGGPTECFVQFSIRSDKFDYLKYRGPITGVATGPCDTANTFFEEELYYIGEYREKDKNEWVNLADDPRYDNVKRWISQFLADSALFYQIPPYIKLKNNAPLLCRYDYNDTIELGYDLYDPDGLLVTGVPAEYVLRWETSLNPGTYYSGSNFRKTLAELTDTATFGSESEILVYVEVLNPAGQVLAQDVLDIEINTTLAPDLTFTPLVNGNEVSISNPIFQNAENVRSFVWTWGDGTEFRGDQVPATHKYSQPGTYNVKCRMLFGNDTANLCSTVETQSVVIDAVDFNEGVCMAPINLRVAKLTARKAKIQWNEVYGALSYEIRARRVTGPDSNWVSVLAPANTIWPRLQADQEYELQVRSICDVALGFTSVSEWSYPIRFATKQCDPPRNIQIDSTTETTATVSWIENQNALDGYILTVGTAASSLTDMAYSNSPAVLTGLDTATTYFFKMRSRCPNLTGSSIFNGPASAPYSFDTEGGTSRMAQFDPEMQVAPNPAVNFFQVRWSAEFNSDARIIVTDIFGRVILESTADQAAGFNYVRLSSEGFANGMYQATLVVGEQTWSKSFVVER